VDEPVNPTDSYSARNVSPEFAARSNSQTAQADNQDYFVNNYRYNTNSNLNSWNTNFNTWNSNAWYSPNYYGSSINSWNTPYYGSYYDAYGSPWYNPYYRSGWSSSFSYYWGSSYNYGWGSGYGMACAYGNPYMNSWGYSPYYGSGWGNSYYPGSVVVVNNNYVEAGKNVVYGKRASRGSAVTTAVDGANTRTRSNYVAPDSRASTVGGRVATITKSQRQEDYYNRSWRNSQQSDAYPSRSSSNTFNSWSNGSNSGRSGTDSFNRHDSGSSSSAPARSSSSMDSGGGATRSSAPASSGSNGRSRGRD